MKDLTRDVRDSWPQRGLTLVAYYGVKEPAFQTFLSEARTLLIREGVAIVPRPFDEVHVTIVGLIDPELSHEPPAGGDLNGFCRYVREELCNEPVNVRFGGYVPGVAYGLTSRGESLFQRSAVVTDAQVIIIGWPWSGAHVTPLLEKVRRDAQRYGYRHKYHQTGADVDVDAYMVVADFEEVPTSEEKERIQARLRRWLQSHVLKAPLSTGQLSLVDYIDNRLPRATSRRHALPMQPFNCS